MPGSIRVGIQQPSLAKYRVPVFRELASRAGIDLTVIYGDRKGIRNAEPEGFAGQPTRLHRSRALGMPLYWHWPQCKLANRKFSDVVILTWNVQYLTLLPAIMRAKANGVKTILWGHGYSKNESGWKTKIRSSVGRFADALLFYNQSTADHFIERGFPSKRIHVAPNSLDQSEIQSCRAHWLAEPQRLDEFRKQHQLDGPNILFVSRFHPSNRLDLLIECVARLKSDFPSITLNLVGSGDEEQQRLQGLVDSLALANNVKFRGAIYEEMEIAPWFLTADVFCYPANIGLSLLHAFGYGVPVITSDDKKSQNPEIDAFNDQENGLFFRHGSVEDLENRLRTIIENQSLRESMSNHALATVLERFNVKTMVDGMEGAIRFCVNR